ncbi:MAG: hypothetical protein GY696_37395 [Gammaproteobacteria bacterium]|nr:hypothetical protein [Gammaproteobacteria bacterium]
MKQIQEIMKGKTVGAKDDATLRDAPSSSIFASPSEKKEKETMERQNQIRQLRRNMLKKEQRKKMEETGGSTSTGLSDYTSGRETETTQPSADPTPILDTTGKSSLHKSTAESKTGTRSTFTGSTRRKSVTDRSSEWTNTSNKSGKSSDGDYMSTYRDNQSVSIGVSEVQDEEDINSGAGTEGMDVKAVNKDNSGYLVL